MNEFEPTTDELVDALLRLSDEDKEKFFEMIRSSRILKAKAASGLLRVVTEEGIGVFETIRRNVIRAAEQGDEQAKKNIERHPEFYSGGGEFDSKLVEKLKADRLAGFN